MNNIKAIIFDWGNTLMRDFTHYQGPMAFWPEIEVISGVPIVLNYLKGKYILCVATNAGDSNTELMIQSLIRGNINQYFDYFYSSKDLGYSKPDPKFFQAISKAIDITPNNCIMIGNDYKKDIIGASISGMKTIWFNETQDSVINKEYDFEINNILEITKIL